MRTPDLAKPSSSKANPPPVSPKSSLPRRRAPATHQVRTRPSHSRQSPVSDAPLGYGETRHHIYELHKQAAADSDTPPPSRTTLGPAPAQPPGSNRPENQN